MSEPVLTEIKTRKDPKAALSASHCPRPTHDNRALTFLFNLVQIKQHSYTVSWGAWRPTHGPTRREFSDLILWDSGFKRGFLIYYCALLPLTQYASIGVLVWENCFLDNLHDNPLDNQRNNLHIPGRWILNRKLSGWRLCSELNMIFIFHDNSDGDDDNAFCIVMLMQVPGVTGRPCKETLHWCPPCWLWTFFCPQCLSDWLMDVCGLKGCVCLSFYPPTYMFLSISWFDFCLSAL